MKRIVFCLINILLLAVSSSALTGFASYTKVYEPATSWPMAATVAWMADGNTPEIARADVRPATTFVWLDAGLKVYDRDGGLLSDSLDSYIRATAGAFIPAFYIREAATAAALKAWLRESGLRDCFVVSTPDNAELVRDLADLLHIRGMLDYTATKHSSPGPMLTPWNIIPATAFVSPRPAIRIPSNPTHTRSSA